MGLAITHDTGIWEVEDGLYRATPFGRDLLRKIADEMG
jgi:hypothetical protein